MEPHPFPVFRKLTNGLSFFRISSDTAFTEVQRIGKRCVTFHVRAGTYAERLRIADMLAAVDGSIVPCDRSEFDAWLERAENRPFPGS